MIKKTIVAALLAASFASIAIPASAAVYARVAPPPLRVEVVPAARPGRTWVAGHWEWRSNRHVWVAGNWIRDRRGYTYVQPAWTEQDGRWQMQRGNWRRGDADGDGVPNGRDRAPNNPNRS
jgi:WXXGXW repeat (2 copies)